MANAKTIAKAETKTPKKAKFSDIINSAAAKKSIANVLQDPKRQQRYISSIVTTVANNPALQECTFASILSASLLGESLNLSHSPQLGQYFMVPFKDKKAGETRASFILSYKGYVQLALRSGYYKKLNVLPIKEGELISYDPLTEDIEVRMIEDAGERENAPTVGYYAMFEYMNGFRKTMYWTKDKMLTHADKYSQAFSKDGAEIKTQYGTKHKVSFAEYEAGNYPKADEWMYSSFWYKDFDAMAMKTMLRQLISKWGIMSVEMQDAISQDIQNDRENGGDNSDFDYVSDALTEDVGTPVVDESTGEIKEPASDQTVISLDDL